MPIPFSAITSRFIESSWKILFQEIPTSETVQNISKFLKFGAGMIIAKFLTIATQIIMGRQLGPEIYGQITIILLLASYFAMPIVSSWGLVFTKIASQNTDTYQRLQALKSLLLIVSLCCIITISVIFTLRKPLAIWFDIDSQMMQLIIVMTVCYAWWILSKQIQQGFQKWHMYVTTETIYAVVVLAVMVGTIFWSKANLYTVSLALVTGYFLAGLFCGRVIWQSFYAKFHAPFTQDILSHGFVLLLNGLVGVATFSIDRILLNRALGATEVGIYQAHFLATYGVISTFMTILLTYAFPTFCRNQKNDIHIVIGKLNKIQYPITVLFSIFVSRAIIWMYSYPVSLCLLASLCLFNGVQFHLQLKTWYIASKGTSTTKIVLKSQVLFLITNVVLLQILVQHIGIIAGGISLLLASCLALSYLIYTEKINHERTI